MNTQMFDRLSFNYVIKFHWYQRLSKNTLLLKSGAGCIFGESKVKNIRFP
jgi:hypothetical protein